MVSYIPDQMDIIMIDLDPQKGTEIAKRRPCLVLSKRIINKSSHRILVCPITSTPPFSQLHLTLPDQMITKGTLLLDQIRTLDYTKRNPKKIETLKDVEFYDTIVQYVLIFIKR